MEKRKLTKEDLDKVRDIEGFPIGTDEDIIALSDAPYYTACPNPFIKEFIEENGTPYDEEKDDYHCEPFAADVSEGKYHPIYRLHPYHTKVPHRAIVKYIMHYTKPGDIVFDGFCGTGMTGVAATVCGHPENDLKVEIDNAEKNAIWGKRNSILADLSPAATFFAYAANSKQDVAKLTDEIKDILKKCDEECGWMFETDHPGAFNNIRGTINFMVWSDVYICPHCGKEFVFWKNGVDVKHGKVLKSFKCPSCHASLKKNDCQVVMEPYYDSELNKNSSMKKQVPVYINYSYGGKTYEKEPDNFDLELIKKIESYKIPYWYPTNRMCEGGEARRNDDIGVTHVHHFYTKRNLAYLACFYHHCSKPIHKLFLTRVAFRITKRYALTYMSGHWGAGGGPTSGTLYIPSLMKELPIGRQINAALKPITEALGIIGSTGDNCLITTQSSSQLKDLADNSVDYIFIDPPFGSNLMYSELNFIWEAWLKVITAPKEEAIVNQPENKAIKDYHQILVRCLQEFYRILKPNRWMTIEFHNSQNAIWNSIREAIQISGFVIADVRVLDKKKGSFIQATTTSAVKQDLVISAYKPQNKFTKIMHEEAGTDETAWAFVRQHLANLPVVVDSDHDGKIDIIAERQAYLLFDRMVAYHIMNGIPVPIDATDFYKGLDEKFLKRDGMYFLPDQVNEYDTARIKMDVEPTQFELFVSNEKSAIAWLYQQLDTPQTYAELQPKFMQEVKSVDRYEDMPELSVMLDENFIQDDKGRWYIPDRTKEGDVAKLREKNLWKEFESYMNSKGKLKLFRSEAIRVGFSRLWKDKNYQAIVDMAERLPEQTIQEDDKLLMYYDISLSRVQ